MNEKEDEDVSIDFSRIRNFFKSGKKEKNVEEVTQHSSANKAEEKPQQSFAIYKTEEKEDDDISIDFSKIKNFFKSDERDDKKEHIARDEDKKDDEELSFDAKKSKISGISENSDEEFSIDFSSIKKFFKSNEKESTAGEDIHVNWNSIINFFKKYGIVFLALIPLILAIYIRMQVGSLSFTDDWAASSVINGITSQIRAGIDKQYPNLPDANKNALVDTELQKTINQNRQQIDNTIKAYSKSFKEFFQDENGKTYMSDIDPYYWFRYAKNILDHGYPGDALKDGKPFDNHQLAPVGRFVVSDMFHPFSLAYFYKFLHFFVPDMTLMRSMHYNTVFLSALCVLLVFLIARRITGDLGGFFAGLMMAVNAAFLSRSLHPDNDVTVILFPLLVTWLFVVTIDVKDTKKIVFLTALAGFFTGLYTFAWSGWWYIFDFLLATIALTFLYLLLANFSEIRRNISSFYSNTAIRNVVLIGLLYFFSTAIFATLISGWPAFRNSFLGPLSFPSIKEPVSASLWPNVLTTVAELNEGSINGIINSIGGTFLFFISLLGLILAISRKEGIKKFDVIYIILTAVFYAGLFVNFGSKADPKYIYASVSFTTFMILLLLPVMIRIGIAIYKKDTLYDFRLPILLSIWVVSTIFASIRGIRFTLLLAPAVSVAFGVALGKIYAYLSKWLTKELKIQKLIGSGILIVLLLLAYVNPIRGAIGEAGRDMPIINDAWYNTLMSIKQDSRENAILTSWWDFGHHFKALADRPVTFDGTTQTSPAAHWVGKLLMIDDELQAVGILRMLDCGSNSAFNALYEINKDTHKSIKILNEIILLDKEKAHKRLMEYGLTEQQSDKVLSFTHCNPPQAYFIASEDMIGKSGVWSHFGSWNFERADIWQNARKMPQEKAVEYMMREFNYTKDKAENVYFEIQSIYNEPNPIKRDRDANSWVAPWPGYGGTISCSKNKNEIYVCSNGLQINLSSYDIFGIGQQGIIRPKVAAFTTEDGIFKKEFNGTNLDFGLTIIPKNENELQVVLSSKELAGSMFTRMFYMQGHGLRYFKLFNHQRGLTGTNIYTYKTDWEGKNTTIVKEYVDFLTKPVKEEKVIEEVKPEPDKNNTNAANSFK